LFIHPTADISASARIGEGTKIWHDVQIRPRAVIGNECILGKGVYLDEDVIVGNRVKIQNRASIYKDCTLEDGVFIGPHVCFTNDMFPRAINPDGSLKSASDWQAGRTLVRFGAAVGAGSVILPSKTIGRFAMIGAGSVVTKDVPDYGLVVGNPARFIGFVCECGHRLTVVDGGARCAECDQTYLASGGRLRLVTLGRDNVPVEQVIGAHD
jgi:acetyltransferase-like isoleucine patch superfamily enzyme